MKKSMLMMVIFLALGSQAIANNFAELNLSIEPFGHLKVVFDGHLIPSRDYHINIKNIPAGNHSLQVFKVLRNYNSYNEEPLFIGEVYLPQNTVTNGLIKHQKFIIQEQYALNYNNGNHYGQFYETKPYPAPTCEVIIEAPAPVYHQEVIEVFPINNISFEQLKISIDSQWFSDGKMAVFTQATSSNYFTSLQVKQLIALFSFSGERLEVAKKAYSQTLDPENYFLVYESLEWNSSVQHLSNYIASL